MSTALVTPDCDASTVCHMDVLRINHILEHNQDEKSDFLTEIHQTNCNAR